MEEIKLSVRRLVEFLLRSAEAALSRAMLRGEDIAYLEEPYLPHRIVGAIDRNPEEGVKLLDVKK